MGGFHHRATVLSLLSLGLAAPVPLVAASSVPVVTPPCDASNSLTVLVSGYITPKCTVDTRESEGDFGAILNQTTGVAAPVKLSLPFTMNCNAPYEAELISKSGGLVFEGTAAPAFAQSVDYTAALDMSGIAGGIALSCESQSMRSSGAGQSGCSANSANDVTVAAGDASIQLQLQPGILPLQMGIYADKLTLRLSPRV